MAEEILGISGQMDISDIQSSLDKLCDSLTRVGVDTDALSSRMTKALNDIAKSDDDLATKTQQAMQTLKSAMDEASKGIQNVPDMIDNANKRVETIEGTISKLNEKLAETEKGTGAFDALTKQLDAQKQSLQLAKEDVVELSKSYNTVKNSISEVSGAYQALGALSTATTGANSAQSVANAAVVASASTAAAAVTAEAGANTASTAAAIANTAAKGENAQATQQLTESLREYMSVAAGRADIERMQSESAKELNSDIKLYESAIKDIQEALNSTDFSKNIEEATAKIEKQKARIEEYKQALANLTPEESANGGALYYNRRIDEAQQKVSQLQKQVNDWGQEQNRLNENLKEYNAQLEAAKRIQKGDNLTGSFKDAAENAKKTAKETQNIGKEAEKSSSKVKGIFGGLKSSFSGLMKGDFSGLFKFVGKIGVWGAGIAAVGKGLFELSKAAEEFRVALQPLDHYMDADKIKDVRQNILALTATTTKSCADMANAALQFVKVWDGLKDAPGALTQMIKSANEYGALTGKTSEEGAKAISKMASEYHMTAQEASEMSNIIASASKHSVSSFGEMSDAIASAGSTASLYGIGFKEMATLIGYSSGQFGDANKAASKFSMLLMSMSKLQDKYNPSVVGMVTALKNLKDAYERGENVASKFMARNRSVAMYFIKNADAIEQYGKKLEDAHAKNELLSDLSSRASTNLAALKNEWNGFLTGLNANLTPVLTNILKFFRTITGGAQEAADVLHYLKVMDNEKGRSKASIGPVGTGGFNANLAGSTIAEGADVDLYKKQRDALQKIYSKAVAAARNKYKPNSKTGYKGISAEGMFNAGMNAVKKAIEDNSQNYSQFKKNRIYNYFYKENKKNTLALNQKPNNTNTDLGGGFGGDDKGEEARKYRDQQAELQAKEEARKRKERWDLYVAEEENGIAKEKDVAEKERRQRALDFEKKMHQLDEEAEQLKQKNIDTAKANYEKDPANKKKEGFYALGLDKKVGLTSEQQKYIQTKKDTLLAENAESERKYLREQLQYYYDYLKEFGSIQEQKYAIAKEYDEKIAKATSSNQRKLLEEQKKSSLANVELEAVKQNIDWGSVFGDFGTMFKDQLEPTIKSLKQLASKTENVDEKKTIWELVSKLQKTGTLWDSDIFVTISDDLKTYQEAMRSYAEAQKKEQKIAEELTKAEERLKNAQESGNEKDILDASATVDKLKNQMSEAAGATKENKDAVVKATTDLQTSSQRAINQFQQLESCLSGLTSGTLKGIGDALMGLDKLFGGKATDKAANSLVKMTTELFGSNSKVSQTLTKVLGESGIAGEIVSAALGILDTLKDGVENLVSSLIDTILGAVNGLIKTALSPKTATGILKSVFDGVTSIFDTLSFGTISKVFGDNSAKMESKIDKLNTSNEALKMSIDNLSDKIEKSNSLSEILNAQNKKEKQTKELEQNTSKQMIYETWKHGAFRSNLAASVEDNKGWKDAMKQVSAILGKKVVTSRDFLSLSAEEMQRIIDSDNGAELWAKILNEYNKEGGKGGRSNKLSDMLNQYVNDFGNVAQDMADELKEKLNGISFDSMKDSFISALMDMDKNAEDFASDFSKIMQQALLNLSVDELINGSGNNPNGDSLKKLYDDMAEAMKNGTYKSRAEEFAQRQQKLLEQGMKMRDELAQFTGYGEQSSQSATGKAIEAITSDQASTLIGIGYAVQSAVEQGNATRENIHSNVEVICSYQMLMSDNISEIRDMQYQGLNQLQKIAKNTEPITGINENIANMYKLMKERI